MSLLSQFEDYKTRLNDEIASLCTGKGKLLDETYREIFNQAKTVVYEHPTTGYRRHSLESRDGYEDRYYRSGDVHTIEVETNLTFQGTQWSPDLAVVISGGLTNFHMPGPRPWIREAENIMRDKAQGIVVSALSSRGL